MCDYLWDKLLDGPYALKDVCIYNLIGITKMLSIEFLTVYTPLAICVFICQCSVLTEFLISASVMEKVVFLTLF